MSEPGTDSSPPPHLVVAFDVIGGRFAIDDGGLGVAFGEVCSFAPDTVIWEGLGLGHGDSLLAMIGGATRQFYTGMRWSGWQTDRQALSLRCGFSLYPPPFTEAGRDLDAVSRRAKPLAELHRFYDAAAVNPNAS